MRKIKILQGDITTQKVDCIVNAANTTLLGGGGVDGAIHRAAGPELLAACCPLHGCATGEAKITPGFRLPAKFVVHTPGPIWHGGQEHEAQLLANSYRNSLQLAVSHGCQTVDFSSISTGVYHFPLAQAAQIALKTIQQVVLEQPSLQAVTMVCFDAATLAAYQQAAHELNIQLLA